MPTVATSLLKQFETTWQRGANHGQKPTKRSQPTNVIDIRAAREAATTFGRNYWHRFISAQSRTFYQLAGVVVLMSFFGLVMVLSSSYADQLEKQNNWWGAVFTQAIAILPGLIGMAALSLASLEWLRRRAVVILAMAIGLQGLTLSPLGVSVNGNRNWLHLGFANIQPSEFLKLAMIVAVSGYLYLNESYFNDPKTWCARFGFQGCRWARSSSVSTLEQ